MSADWSQPAADCAVPPGWEAIAGELADRYRLHVDGAGPPGKVRYTAVARSLDIRPYAIVTTDPAELRQALTRVKATSSGGHDAAEARP